MIRTWILTLSDKAAKGEREDLTGPALVDYLRDYATTYQVTKQSVQSDEFAPLVEALTEGINSGEFDLILTNGGTGCSPRDNTPEATLAVAKKQVPGIAEVMRQGSLAITPLAMLSRGVAAIGAQTLIVNLPGSPKAAVENLSFVVDALPHAIKVLRQEVSECATTLPCTCGSSMSNTTSGQQGMADTISKEQSMHKTATDIGASYFPELSTTEGMVSSVNISVKRGTIKRPIEYGILIPEHGIEGDAHAGKWHRQISLLAEESVDQMRDAVKFPLKQGIFAENINTRGLNLLALPVGTKLKIGKAVLRVTQIGKECHNDGCAIMRTAGTCVMPTEGIFAEVLVGGQVRAGDQIIVEPA